MKRIAKEFLCSCVEILEDLPKNLHFIYPIFKNEVVS